MDAVILAAGRNQRLQHIIAPYHKPLIVINGKTVLGHNLDFAESFAAFRDRIITVCAPQNAEQLAHVVNDRVNSHLAVQSSARGPGDALWHGLQLVRAEHVLVLMGDNVTPVTDQVDFKIDGHVDFRAKIGVQSTLDQRRAASFTVWDHIDKRWVEKVPIGASHVNNGWVTCWFGPLVLRAETALEVLDAARVDEDGTVRPELLIGPLLSDLAPDACHIYNHTYDVDTEVLR